MLHVLRILLPRLALTLVIVLGWSARLQAQTTTLMAVADTYLKQGTPNKNQGAELVLRVQQSGMNRALVYFDQTEIDAVVGDGTLVVATLELFIAQNGNNWGSAGRMVDIHRLTADWTEHGATWQCGNDPNPSNAQPDCTSQWAGGTFAEDATDSVLHTNGRTGWIRFNVTGDVLAFLTGTSNQGWLLKKQDEGQSGLVEYTSIEGTPVQAPRLVLVVESPGADTVPPRVEITAPRQTILVNDPTPAIVAAYADGGSGIDRTSVRIFLDTAELTPACTIGPATATCEASTLVAGQHTVSAEVGDLARNLATASTSFALLLGPGPHQVTLQAQADTYLKRGTPNQNQGNKPMLSVRQSGTNRALVRFDQADIDTAVGDGTLLAATLELFIEHNADNWGHAGRTVDVHRLMADWTELGATWQCSNDANPGNTQPDCTPQWTGGDFDPTATDSVLHTNDLVGWVPFDVTPDVQAFLAGTPNYGWLLKKTAENQSGLVEYTAREGTVEQDPRLVLVFEVEDQVPPILHVTSPSGPYVLNNPTPAIVVTYSDENTEIDLTSVHIVIDAMNITSTCTVGSTMVTCVSPAMAAGPHTIAAEVRDQAGNLATASVHFTLLLNALCMPGATAVCYDGPPGTVGVGQCTTGSRTCKADGTFEACTGQVLPQPEIPGNTLDEDCDGIVAVITPTDTTPPSLAITVPSALAINHPVSAITVTYADGDSGINLTTLRILLDTIELTHTCFVGATVASCEELALELGDGLHTIKVTLRDVAGNLATASHEVLLDTTPPRITIGLSADGEGTPESITVTTASITITGTIDDNGEETVGSGPGQVTVNGLVAQVADRRFVVEAVPLRPGRNTITVIGMDQAGNTATTSMTVVFNDPNAAIALAILEPPDRALVAGPTVTVQGTVTNITGNETGITVNGVVALVHGGQFVANQVPLQEGANLLPIVATDSAGNTTTTTLTVHREATGGYIRLTANTYAGLAPFETTLRLDGPVTITAPSLFVTGPGDAEVVAAPDATEYTVRLTATGLYFATAWASDDAGNLYNHTIALQVVDRTTLDTVLQARWDGMKQALASQDIPTAVNFFTKETKDLYQEAFTVLSPQLPQLVQEMQDIQLIWAEDQAAKYRIRRAELYGGQRMTITYYIYFRTDSDGLWKILRY